LLTHGNKQRIKSKEVLMDDAMNPLASMIEFIPGAPGTFSIIQVKAFEPMLAKEMANVVLEELEDLNYFFRSQNVKQKIGCIP